MHVTLMMEVILIYGSPPDDGLISTSPSKSVVSRLIISQLQNVVSIVEYVFVNCEDLNSEEITALASETRDAVDDLAVAEGKKKKEKKHASKKKRKKKKKKWGKKEVKNKKGFKKEMRSHKKKSHKKKSKKKGMKKKKKGKLASSETTTKLFHHCLIKDF
ncbi:hypothetical protein GZH46_02820 [Fragariocoptes setiger]|uniref:Uncharacterized protein n=1 Tax=Fragariocoptes setiger TaxID=1670756 RepID=A0ABQ7S611_9ACAR|nr:hypothetical protein GZH46_02820 [Fragariocoptes setiger]